MLIAIFEVCLDTLTSLMFHTTVMQVSVFLSALSSSRVLGEVLGLRVDLASGGVWAILTGRVVVLDHS